MKFILSYREHVIYTPPSGVPVEPYREGVEDSNRFFGNGATTGAYKEDI